MPRISPMAGKQFTELSKYTGEYGGADLLKG